jgi:uncharacterized protein
VSGINGPLAKKIVKYRDEKGKIASREELTSVPGMGPKSFEQCAGFLKIPESANPLDNTWVHPENYAIAKIIRDTITATGNLASVESKALQEQYGVGSTTISDIVEELKKPNRDPREGYPKPIMQKGVVNFEDLSEGMMITGKIKNVVDFGAFVDLGIKETALVHISELSDHFVKDPMDAVKVGDVLEFRIIGLDLDRRRISLSRKSPGAEAGGHGAAGGGATAGPGGESRKKVVVKKGDSVGNSGHGNGGSAGAGGRAGPGNGDTRPNRGGAYAGRGGADSQRPSRDRPSANDDGTMYNPFAEAFKKMKEKK